LLCDNRISLRLKGRVYRIVIRSAPLCGTEYWSIKKSHLKMMNVAEMRIIR